MSLRKRRAKSRSGEGARRLLRFFLLTWLACLGGSWLLGEARAHNPDTSYARFHLAPNEVSSRLTFDLFTLQKVAALDADDDKAITRQELQAGLPRIQNFLERHLQLEINEQPAGLGELAGAVWPPESGESIAERDWHTAAALVHLNFSRRVGEMPESVTATFEFGELSERHTVLGAFVYNGQEEEVIFTRFEPDFLYFTGYETPLGTRLLRFFKLGVEHIFLGYDHLCFLLALMVVSRLGELVKIVTAFTVAHSLTLVLATLEVIELPGRLVESAIALTIVYVAVENIWRRDTRHRWILAFGFGLIHGFGFAGVLRELGLPNAGVVRCLISFNLGVEFGQLAIVLLFLPLSWGLASWRHGRQMTNGISLILAAFGLAWFVDRTLALEWMPF